jgi:hypothetical protein
MAQDDAFKFLVLSRSDQEKNQLQNAGERDVQDRYEHGASEEYNRPSILRSPNFAHPTGFRNRSLECDRLGGFLILTRRRRIRWLFVSQV